MNTSTEKRLFQYAWQFKHSILIGIACLIVAVILELAGPLIAKTIIDEHVLGVEGNWHEVNESDYKQTASYEGKYYKRADRTTEDEEVLSLITLMQIGNAYYLIEDDISLIGKRTVDEQTITIEQADLIIQATGNKLSLRDMSSFFNLERKPILLLLGLYMILLIIAGVFKFFEAFTLQKASNQIVKKLRNDIFSHTQRLPIDYYVKHSAGGIVSRVTNDTEAIRELYERVLSFIVSSVIYMIGIFIALFILDAKLAVISLLLIPLIYGWMMLYKHFGTKYNQVIRSTLSEINGNINETIQGMPIIQAFRREKQMNKDFNKLNQRHFNYQRKLVKLNALTSYNLVNVFRNIAFVGFIWYFGSFSLEPGAIISIGMLYAIVDYLTRLFEPVNNIVNQLPLIEQARVAGNRVFELMDHEGEYEDNHELDKYKGQIYFDKVTFAYDDENTILNDISFEVKPGQTVAFVGHTGSGKSTIMNLLFRFYDPQEGSITIDGFSTEEWSRQEVRSHMGIVLQDPFLFSGTIISNITMNDPDISRERGIRALKMIGADRFITKLPQGYDSEVTEGGTTFSLGERQLLSFARALAFDPAILVLDEATANVDTETEKLIQEALNVLQEGRTTLVIAHRLSTVQQADTIFVLEHGTIKERGDHQTLINKKGLYYQMYEMQQGYPLNSV